MDIRLGLTFDDVLLLPAESSLVPSEADTGTRLTRGIEISFLLRDKPCLGEPDDEPSSFQYLPPFVSPLSCLRDTSLTDTSSLWPAGSSSWVRLRSR